MPSNYRKKMLRGAASGRLGAFKSSVNKKQLRSDVNAGGGTGAGPYSMA